jgi:hypothetical protein
MTTLANLAFPLYVPRHTRRHAAPTRLLRALGAAVLFAVFHSRAVA